MSEPREVGQVAVVRIPVMRVGDSSKVSVVRVHTKDGSAASGEDYHPISKGRALSSSSAIARLSHCRWTLGLNAREGYNSGAVEPYRKETEFY